MKRKASERIGHAIRIVENLCWPDVVRIKWRLDPHEKQLDLYGLISDDAWENRRDLVAKLTAERLQAEMPAGLVRPGVQVRINVAFRSVAEQERMRDPDWE